MFDELKLICIANYKIVLCVLVMCILDIITGIIKSIKNKEYSSSQLKKGLLQKPLYLIVIVGLAIVQLAFGIPEFTFTVINTTITIGIVSGLACFFILNEFTSIIENTSEYIHYPKWLLSILAKLNSSFDDLPID